MGGIDPPPSSDLVPSAALVPAEPIAAWPPLIGFRGRARSVGPYPAGDGEPAGDDRMSVDGAHEPSGRLRPRKPITYDESRHDGSSSRSETSSHPPGPSDSASGLQLTRHQRPSRSPPGRARKATAHWLTRSSSQCWSLSVCILMVATRRSKAAQSLPLMEDQSTESAPAPISEGVARARAAGAANAQFQKIL